MNAILLESRKLADFVLSVRAEFAYKSGLDHGYHLFLNLLLKQPR